jgi:hypothetical protein
MRRASAPVHLTPILSSNSEDVSATPRHVYFEDSSIPPLVRRNTLPAPEQRPMYSDIAPAASIPLTISPLATTSALPTQDGIDDILVESDTSPHSSKASLVKSSSRLHKLKLFGHGKATSRLEVLDKPGDQASIASTGQHFLSERP